LHYWWLNFQGEQDKRSFRKIVGYRAMPMLVAALRAHDAKIDRASTVDHAEKAA
jgi:hypothetical protein